MNSVVTAYPDPLPEATSTSLSLPDTLTFEQWEEIGAELANRARKLNWWIGDWWAAGHHRYGERARLAARGLFGKEFKTLANIASVCRAFEPARRREHLSWSHHAEAAALSPPAADMLLDLAERDRLSKAQVRAAVTTIRGGPVARTASPDEAAVAGLFRAYNRLPGEVRMLVAQAFAAVAASGSEIDPATGNPRIDEPAPGGDAAAEPALDLAFEPDAEIIEAEPGAAQDEVLPEAAAPLVLKPEMEAPAPVTEPAPPLDLAEMDDLPTAGAAYIEYDLTLDMAELAAQAKAEAPVDLDLDMAMPEDSRPEAPLELDTELAEPQPTREGRAFDLGPERDDEDEAIKAKARKTEPWLLR